MNKMQEKTNVLTMSQNMDLVINQAIEQIKKDTITDQDLEQLKLNYAVLEISGVNDKEGYKAVSDGILLCRNTRGKIEKARKLATEPALKFQRDLIKEANRINDTLLEIEKSLKDKKQLIDDEKERIKKAAEMRFMNRTNQLFSLGYFFDGSNYIFDGRDAGVKESLIAPADIADNNDEQWAVIYDECVEIVSFVKGIRARVKQEAEELAKREIELQQQKDAEIAELRAKLAALERIDSPTKELQEYNEETGGLNSAILTPNRVPSSEVVSESNNDLNNTVIRRIVPGQSHVNNFPNIETNNHESGISNVLADVQIERITGYIMCKKQVIALFEDENNKYTRAGWLEIFKNLQPNEAGE